MTFTPPPPEMIARQKGARETMRQGAREKLGVAGDATEEQIKQAFRERVRGLHPDRQSRSAGGGDVPVADMDMYKRARDFLLGEIKQAEEINQNSPKDATETCPMCGGYGSVVDGFKSETCATCAGTGQVGA